MTQHLGRVLVAGLAAASALIAINTTQPTSAASLPPGLALEGHVLQLRGAPPTVAVGTNPISLAVDDETRTAYVATAVGVSVVDVSHCKVGDHAGCGQTVTTLAFGKDDIDVLVDPATRSVYVSSSRTDSVIVFGTARCNARDLSGCGGSRHRVRVGGAVPRRRGDRPTLSDVVRRQHTE